jgi:Cu/Ag efflux protein CusF
MKKLGLAVGVVLATAMPWAQAQDKSGAKGDAKADVVVTKEPGKAKMAGIAKITAKVLAVDAANRQLTLKGPRGKEEVVTVSQDVKNFDQIKVGDDVVVRYYEALSLTLVKDGKELVERKEKSGAVKAKPGERPAAAVGRQVEVVANVTAVDAKTQKVTLKGPNQTVEMKVPDPEQFKLIKVGDQIKAVYEEAVALSVETAPAKAAPKK